MLLLPVLQTLGAEWFRSHPRSTHPRLLGFGLRSLQRLYQLTLVGLLVGAGLHLFHPLHGSLTAMFGAVGLGTLAVDPRADLPATPADPEIQITATGEKALWRYPARGLHLGLGTPRSF